VGLAAVQRVSETTFAVRISHADEGIAVTLY